MDHAFPTANGSGVLLFDEDFDLPPPAAAPKVAAPVYSAFDMEMAREAAARDSRDRALAEADASTLTVARQTLTAISAQLGEAREESAVAVEQSAAAVARLLLGCFAAAFPAMSARHGEAEVAALLRAILPALQREPKITIRVSPHCVIALTEEIQTLDADLLARVRFVPTDAIAPGDARVTWENGAATRDTTSLWAQIEGILAPAGLLRPANAPAPASRPNSEPAAKEHELVQ